MGTQPRHKGELLATGFIYFFNCSFLSNSEEESELTLLHTSGTRWKAGDPAALVDHLW